MSVHGRNPMSLKMKPILSVCLNPAWQKTLLFDTFVPGAVNRAGEVHETGGGKGVNLARGLRCIGEPVTVALFVGGDTGQHLLAELEKHHIRPLVVHVPEATRVCTTVVDRSSRTTTELIEPSGIVPQGCVADMAERIRASLPSVAAVALCGTYPPGVPPSLYADIAAHARAAGLPVLLDGVRGVDETLQSGVDVLKINRTELSELTGARDPQRALQRCFERFHLSWLLVTDGAHTAYLAGAAAACRIFELPPVTPLCNAIGAGDCASGVLLAELTRAASAAKTAVSALPPETVAQACVKALAAASASCMTDLPALFEPRRQQELQKKIRVLASPPHP
jgi:tagatose 6-phosphate kinase